MAKEIVADAGDDFRMVCPDCKSTWTTYKLPSECPGCGAVVTVRVISRPNPPSPNT
jgi:ribosomal protein S27E